MNGSCGVDGAAGGRWSRRQQLEQRSGGIEQPAAGGLRKWPLLERTVRSVRSRGDGGQPRKTGEVLRSQITERCIQEYFASCKSVVLNAGTGHTGVLR